MRNSKKQKADPVESAFYIQDIEYKLNYPSEADDDKSNHQ